MTTITFGWHAPHSNGSAITGYFIYVRHLDKEFHLPRSQLTFQLEHLLPGKAYFIRVTAINSVGSSEPSDWNEETYEQSLTLTDKPEQPRNPRVVHGTWNAMVLDIRLPYDNGAALSSMIVMMRWVKPFDRGDWYSPRTFRLMEDVEVIEDVDPDALLKELLEQQRREDEERKAGYNPLKKKKDGINIAAILSAAKPDGSLVRVWIDRLESDTIYEFRVAVKNAAGFSAYSNPSHRAKTNKARTPGPPSVFLIADVTSTQVTFTVNWALQGGAPIDMYLAEMLRKGDKEKTFRIKWERPGPPYANPHEPVALSITDHLQPGQLYQWRMCAENEVGSGPWSEWSDEVMIPGTPEEAAAAAAAAEAEEAEQEAREAEEEESDKEESDLEEYADVLRQSLGGKSNIAGAAAAAAATAAASAGGGVMDSLNIKVPPASKKAP